MTRRRRGDGSLYFDTRRQRWTGQVDLGVQPDGKRLRRKVSAKNPGEAAEKLRALVAELRRSGTVGRQDVTVATVVRDFLAAPPPQWRSQSTVDVNRQHGERIIRGLGRVRLVKLTARDVERFLFAQADLGLSASTITQTRALLSRAIKRAQRDGLTARNAAAEAVLPQAPKRRSKALTHDNVAALLALDLTPWWRAYITTGLSIGLRPGELLGLRWADVDFDAGVIRVRQALHERHGADGWGLVLDSLKTERSKRTLAIPRHLAGVLRAHRAAQTEARLQAGQYEDHGLVFASPAGLPCWRSHVRNGFARLCHRAGIDGTWTLHELRHSFVSLLSDAGVSIEAIADAAGHANPGITGRVYRHVIADRVNVAGSEAMDEILSREART